MSLAQSSFRATNRAFLSRNIQVGNIKIGGMEPIVVQSMTTTDTSNVEATCRQIEELVAVGCQVIRVTVPTVDDALALEKIKSQLERREIFVPLVADVHFVPKAADIAADFVEKVRINPGNFADRKMFKEREYSDSEYNFELERIREKFEPLVLKLKRLNRALRIGTNHGSLSDRIMNRFGDTPLGMVESAFEYASICRDLDFHNFCFSMKASNVRVMVDAYRLLVQEQMNRAWDYPIHLGVTEAGEGEDARIKSAIGIGTLLAEGIGDTIRVSLTEDSIHEIPVAKALAERFAKTKPSISSTYHHVIPTTGLSQVPSVWMSFRDEFELMKSLSNTKLRPDVLFLENSPGDLTQLKEELKRKIQNPSLQLAVLSSEAAVEGADIILGPKSKYKIFEGIQALKESDSIDPAFSILKFDFESRADLDLIIEASHELGAGFVDLPLAGIWVEGVRPDEALRLSFGILQATRRRMSKTEYIACPSCGRTLFDLQETTARIKSKTSHLKNVKIAIMGCIVNGPGEMADADFGYVGGAPGRVNLYVGKNCVDRNIASEEAPDRLVNLIQKHGKWIEPT